MNWRFAAANNFYSWTHSGFLYSSAAATSKQQQSRSCHALYVGRGLKTKKEKLLPQIKTREARCASKLLWSDNDYGFKCTTMSIQNWPFFYYLPRKKQLMIMQEESRLCAKVVKKTQNK